MSWSLSQPVGVSADDPKVAPSELRGLKSLLENLVFAGKGLLGRENIAQGDSETVYVCAYVCTRVCRSVCVHACVYVCMMRQRRWREHGSFADLGVV